MIRGISFKETLCSLFLKKGRFFSRKILKQVKEFVIHKLVRTIEQCSIFSYKQAEIRVLHSDFCLGKMYYKKMICNTFVIHIFRELYYIKFGVIHIFYKMYYIENECNTFVIHIFLKCITLLERVKMKQENKMVSFRLDDETEQMLDELEQNYKTESEKLGLKYQSKSQIIKEAIQTLYAAKLNSNMQNGYLDLMRDQIQQVVEPMLQGSTQFLKEQNEQIIDLAEQALMGMVKLSLQEKLSLYAQKCDTVSEEEIIGFLKSDYSYTSAINKYALSLINGENQENSENE